MANRYTVRSYDTDKKVSEEDLKLILEAGLLSPSKNFLYPYRAFVLKQSSENGKAVIDYLYKKATYYDDHCLADGDIKMNHYLTALKTAPVSILFFLDGAREKENPPNVPWYELERRAARDTMIVVTAMMLQAEQLGYGTTFTAALRGDSQLVGNSELKKKLGLEAKQNPLVILSFGTPLPPEKTRPPNYKPTLVKFGCIGEPTLATTIHIGEEDGRPAMLQSIHDGPNPNRKPRWENIKEL